VDSKIIERARDIASKALAPIGEFPAVELLAFVGGSATTTAAIVRGKRDVIDRYDLSREDLARTLDRLCALDLASRKAIVGMKPQRADILPAGIIVLDSVLEILGKERATATTADLLLGYLLAQRPEKRGRAAETKNPREVRQ
jgi:exopolyphosphatase/guanosine-5'-triphosphate,3'-diphosphate pyrophosphatase